MTTLRTPNRERGISLGWPAKGDNEYASFPVLFMHYWSTGPRLVEELYRPLWVDHWARRLPSFFDKDVPYGYAHYVKDAWTWPWEPVFPCSAQDGFDQKLGEWVKASLSISGLIGLGKENPDTLADLHIKLGAVLRDLVAKEKALEQLEQSDVNVPDSVLSSMPQLRNSMIKVENLVSNLIKSLKELPKTTDKLPELGWEPASLQMRGSINKFLDKTRSNGASEYDVTPARQYVDILVEAEKKIYTQKYAQSMSGAFGQLQTVQALEGILIALAKLRMCAEDLFVGSRLEMSPEVFAATKKELLQQLPEILELLKGLEKTSSGVVKLPW